MFEDIVKQNQTGKIDRLERVVQYTFNCTIVPY